MLVDQTKKGLKYKLMINLFNFKIGLGNSEAFMQVFKRMNILIAGYIKQPAHHVCG
jgi:hypothetical protein